MYAFVNGVGVSSKNTVLPRNGLTSVCGSTLRPAPARTQNSSTLRMSNMDITLQTLVYTPTPVISGIEDKDIMCSRIWKQVFGNAYVMESERAEAYIAESMYRAGRITIKEFVRACALSSTYRRRFFECCGPYRAVELNFKHLLGRGPNSQQEVSKHVQIIANEGFEAEINSYIDSEEYAEAFGEDYVPCMQFKGTYPTITEFNRMCTINSSPGTSDKSLTGRARAIGIENPNHVLSLDGAGVPAKLVSNIVMNGDPSFVSISKAIPSRPDLDLGYTASPFTGKSVINENAAPRRRVEVTLGNYMYLTADEEKAMQAEKLENEQIVSFAQKEAAEARAQIALLEAKLEELALVN